MIIKEFSKYLKNNPDQNSYLLLYNWLKFKINSPVKQNKVNKIIQKEIFMGKNKLNCYFFIGNCQTGQNLLEELYNFATYFENHKNAQKKF